MAQAGQNYTITLQQAHLEWGTHRYTDSRGVVYGEGYIPIPDREARMFNIGANVGDRVKVFWTSPTDIVIEKI